MNANRQKETWISQIDPGFIEGLSSVSNLWSSLLSRPELKFGLIVASPLKRTERESGQILSPLKRTFPS